MWTQAIQRLCASSILMQAIVLVTSRLVTLAPPIRNSQIQVLQLRLHPRQLLQPQPHLEIALVARCLRALLNVLLSHRMCTRRAFLYALTVVTVQSSRSDAFVFISEPNCVGI